jgi:hypothetical protein
MRTTIGSARVEVRDGWIVRALAPDSSEEWTARERRLRITIGPRMLSHAAILGVVASGFGVTVVSAHQAPAQPRLAYQVLAASAPPVIPPSADPTPSPSPIPTPSPKPAPKPAPAPAPVHYSGSIADIIRAAAAQYGVDPNWMLRVANCESHLNPNSYNASSGATGLFQFKPSTFSAHGGHNIWDPVDQSNVAAKMFAQGLAYEWSCK